MLSIFRPYKQFSDEELMVKVHARNYSAFDELFKRYVTILQNFFYRRTGGDCELSSDLTQDIFMRLWSDLTFSPSTSFRSWIFAIAYNQLKHIYRSLSYQDGYVEHIQNTTQEEFEDDPALQIDEEILSQALQKELNQLSEKDQLLMDLRFASNLSVSEIASILDIPEGTVKSKLHTIIVKLRNKLQQYGNF